jgi:parvulin-like peptidyl-prolyl isomerase
VSNITLAQKAALKWLRNRNGDGVFDKNQVLTAAGERAPVMRPTWNKLEKAGMVIFYANRRRIKVTPLGAAFDLAKIEESRNGKFYN